LPAGAAGVDCPAALGRFPGADGDADDDADAGTDEGRAGRRARTGEDATPRQATTMAARAMDILVIIEFRMAIPSV